MTELQATKTGPSSSANAAVGRLFVLELPEDRIHSMNPDGCDRKTIVTNCHLPDGIVVDADAGHIYWWASLFSTSGGNPVRLQGSQGTRARTLCRCQPVHDEQRASNQHAGARGATADDAQP